MELLTGASVSRKGEGQRTYEVVCQFWRRDGGHANIALGYLAASGAVPVCGVCFLNN